MSETHEDEPTRPGNGPGDEAAKIPQVDPPRGGALEDPPTYLPPLTKRVSKEDKPKRRRWFVILAWITLVGLALFTGWITIIAIRLPAMLEAQGGAPGITP